MIETLLFVILLVALGLMVTFLGYPMFRLLLPVWGFLAGLMLGVQMFDSFAGGGFLASSLGLIIGFFLGLFFAGIAYYVYAFAVVLFGAALGYVLGQGLLLLIGFDYGFFTVFAGLAGAVLLAMFFVKGRMPKFLIIVATGMAGAMAVFTGLFVLLGKLPTATISVYLSRYVVYGSFFWFVLWAIVAALGITFQYMLVKQSEELTEAFVLEEYASMEASAASKGTKKPAKKK